MPRFTLAAALLALAACSPAFNWREVRVAPAGLIALMPCKPDSAERSVPMAGRQVALAVLTCRAGGASFSLLHADVGEAGRSAQVLGQWKEATLANLRAQAPSEAPFRPPGALGLRESLLVSAGGERSDGSKVQSRAAYFARGSRVFQAVVYADRLDAEAAETFFAGLKLE